MEQARERQEKTKAFIEDNLKLVTMIASSLIGSNDIPSGIIHEDLVSWGIEGLLKAKKMFKKDKGASFKTYATYRIKGEMLDRIRQEWRHRSPIGYKKHQDEIKERVIQATEMLIQDANRPDSDGTPQERLNEFLSNSALTYLMVVDKFNITKAPEEIADSKGIEEKLEAEENKSIIWGEVEKLDDEERQLIELFYKEELNQKQIADELNWSPSKVCRVHMKVLQKLRGQLQKRLET